MKHCAGLRLLILVASTFFGSISSLTLPAIASIEDLKSPYVKRSIYNSRFGEEERQALLKKAYHLRESIAKTVIGQDRLASALQNRLVQYLENLGTRTKDPIALHLIGLPGIGKSAVLEVLDELEIPILRVDAQNFVDDQNQDILSSFYFGLQELIHEQNETGQPLIILIEELDKIPEIHREGDRVTEKTHPLIGTLNQILTYGKLASVSPAIDFLDLSNTMIVTSMNFSPAEIETFSAEVLGNKKSFYDFTVEDFSQFDDWLKSGTAARSKVLAKLFRSNTVSRLVPNTLIVKPLNHEDYWKITRLQIDKTIETAESSFDSSKKINVEYTEGYLDFLNQVSVYPPSGARETVIRANALTEQLITFGIKTYGKDPRSLVQPRSILLDYDPKVKQVKVSVTPKIRRGSKSVDGERFSFLVNFDSDSLAFEQPPHLVTDPSALKLLSPLFEEQEKPITKREIREVRFPQQKKELVGLAHKIDQKLIGQSEYSALIEAELSAFIGRPGPVKKNPPFLVLAGFPGIGKSELVELASEYSELPIARVNMQGFSSTDSSTLGNFLSSLQEAIQIAKRKSKNGKIIVLFEELDKVFEINPQTGHYVDRPVMNFIKDLLNDGYIRHQYNTLSGNRGTAAIDLRDSYNIITMNFAVDRFGFEADPRLTTIDDMIKRWEGLQGSPADLKRILSTLFLPETVSRLMPRFTIMKPLLKKDYERIIQIQVDQVIRNRLVDKNGKNYGMISINLSPEYQKYLYQESVIPSEGARNTVLVAQQRISIDLEDSLKYLPKNSPLSAIPLIIELDFDPATSTIRATAKPQNPSVALQSQLIFEREVALTFPSLEIPAHEPIPEERLITSIHEFGHAFAAIRIGKRFEYATVVPPQSGIGGYVKFVDHSDTAKSLLGHIYTALGSRAMERIFLSEHPLKESSVLDVTMGAQSDIQSATESLWLMIYEYGFDPSGGTIERKGMINQMRYASFSDLSPQEVNSLGLILREIENHLVEDFLKAHTRQWYARQIRKFAHKGGLTESAFYKMIGYPHPGQNELDFGQPSTLTEIFGKHLESIPAELMKAIEYKQGATKTTATENLKLLVDRLQLSLKTHLHAGPSEAGNYDCSTLWIEPLIVKK